MNENKVVGSGGIVIKMLSALNDFVITNINEMKIKYITAVKYRETSVDLYL